METLIYEAVLDIDSGECTVWLENEVVDSFNAAFDDVDLSDRGWRMTGGFEPFADGWFQTRVIPERAL